MAQGEASITDSSPASYKDDSALAGRHYSNASQNRGIQPAPLAAPPKLQSSRLGSAPVLPSNSYSSSHNGQPQLAPYVSPSSSTHSLSHHPQQYPPMHTQQSHHPSENFYYTSQPSHYSGSSATATYSSSVKSEAQDMMAAAQPIRPQLHNVYPSPSSPSSIHSPHDSHSRPAYAPLQPQQNVYYGHNYPSSQHPSYMQPISQMHHPHQLPSHASFSPTYQQGHGYQHATSQQQDSTLNASPRSKVPLAPSQSRPQLGLAQMSQPGAMSGGNDGHANPHTSPTGQAAAPGPIPATTPLVISTDKDGVEWIAFEYSRDRIKVQYEIRCDIAKVDQESLSKEHKEQNCVYPRACNPREEYKGNRLQYETECNRIGWALSHLNPSLKGKRGLIQRAVDSWRNSNSDTRYRSRRVKRLAKTQKRNQMAAQQQQHQSLGAPSVASVPQAGSLPGHRQVMPGPSSVQYSQHPIKPEDQPQHQQSLETSGYHQHPTHMLPGPSNSESSDTRNVQNFNPIYPPSQPAHVSTLPPTHGPLDHLNAHQPSSVTAAGPIQRETDALVSGISFGRSKKPDKSPIIRDRQRDKSVHVRFRRDGYDQDAVPDTFRRQNAVFPRSHYPRQIQADLCDMNGADSANGEDTEIVSVEVPNDWQTDISIPATRGPRLQCERALNDLGSFVAFDKARQFASRPMFLQQALNRLRKDAEEAYEAANQAPPPSIPLRRGKKNWIRKTSF